MSDRKLRLGVLISGSGTNLQAIMDACSAGSLAAEVVVVISNKEAAYGLERARKAHIDAVFVDRTAYTTMAEYNLTIRDVLKAHEVDYVVMAGYMRLLGREVLAEYPMRVLNIHPALLPSFPGASGLHDAWEYGVKVTGVTVHFADERFDAGPVIAQEAVEIREDDTIESVEARIHEAEYRLYPRALQWLAEGRVSVEGRRVRIS
ncbi:MAG: phosphoribosylglycinamide formyltransferase [Actinobacteria bacterium]|nr:MAG: phosphoribosylglycinamide formyltransferase [Actinomycetota bacterium]